MTDCRLDIVRTIWLSNIKKQMHHHFQTTFTTNYFLKDLQQSCVLGFTLSAKLIEDVCKMQTQHVSLFGNYVFVRCDYAWHLNITCWFAQMQISYKGSALSVTFGFQFISDKE